MTRERTAELRRIDGLRFAATTGTGRTITFGDPPANEQSPVEMIATALGACSAMDVASILEKKRQEVSDYRVSVSANQREEYPQILTRVDVIHDLSGPDVTEVAVRRAIALSATKYCPVNAMISAGDTEIHHRYRVRATDGGPVVAEGEVVVTGPDRRPDVVA